MFFRKKKDSINITMIGSCFCGFLKKPLKDLAGLGAYPGAGPLNFQTATVWQRIDAVVDIINNNIPDHDLISYYIEKGYWEKNKPLGIETKEEIRDSEWFARRILGENKKALSLVNDTPDLLMFDSLSDWRHPLYRNRTNGWRCFLGRILFKEKDLAERFEKDFEFIQLLDISEVNNHIKTVMNYYKSRNRRLRTVYIHFPALAGYLEEKWIKRAEELKREVALLNKEFSDREFYQLIIPEEKVKPLTDPFNPVYSRDIWNHFQEDVYKYCAKAILDWWSDKKGR